MLEISAMWVVPCFNSTSRYLQLFSHCSKFQFTVFLFTPVQDCTDYLRHLKWALNSLNVFDSSLWQFVFAFSPIGTFQLHLCINVQHYIIFTKQNKLSCNIFVGSQTHAEKKSKTKLSFTPNSLMMSFFLNILRWNWAMEPSAHKAGDPVDNWITHMCSSWYQLYSAVWAVVLAKTEVYWASDLIRILSFWHTFRRHWSTAPKTYQQCQNFYQMSGWLRLRM